MKITFVFLALLIGALSVEFSSALPHPVHKLKKVAVVAGAGAHHLIKPKVVVGAALVGKALIAKKLIGGALIGGALLLKKPALIAGGVVAAKLAKKALLVGAGALVAKKIIRAIKPCRRGCTRCSRTRVAAHREAVREAVRTTEVSEPVVVREVQQPVQQAVQEETRKIEKRSITDYVNRGFESVASGIESAGSGLSGLGDTLRRGGERLKDVSNQGRVAGGFVSDTIRSRGANVPLLKNYI